MNENESSSLLSNQTVNTSTFDKYIKIQQLIKDNVYQKHLSKQYI